MAFDRKGFIAAAKSQQIPDEEINSYLESQGVKPLTKGEKFLYGPALPLIGGATGLAGGAVLSPLTFGASIPFGGAAGAGAGTAIQQALKNVFGYQDEDSLQQAQGVTGNAMMGAAVGELPNLIGGLLNPLGQIKDVTSKYREFKLKGMEQNLESAKFNSMEKLKSSDWYLQSPPEARLMAESRLNDYFNQASPMVASNPALAGNITGSSTIGQNPNIGINELYKKLTPFESQGKAYLNSGAAGNTALGQGTNLASHAIREYLTTQVPQSVATANTIYSKAASLPKVLNASPVGALGSYFLGRYLFNLFNKSGGQ